MPVFSGHLPLRTRGAWGWGDRHDRMIHSCIHSFINNDTIVIEPSSHFPLLRYHDHDHDISFPVFPHMSPSLFLSFLSPLCFFPFRVLDILFLLSILPLFSYQRFASTLHPLISNFSDIPFYFFFSFLIRFYFVFLRSRVLFLVFSSSLFWAGCLFLSGGRGTALQYLHPASQ